MTQFVGIRPKNYAYEYLTVGGKIKEDKRCKGIGKSFTPKFNEYLDCVQGAQGNEVNKICFQIIPRNTIYTQLRRTRLQCEIQLLKGFLTQQRSTV